MTSLLKSFGKGLLYILVLPVLIVILAFYVVFGLAIFIYIGFKAIFLFFTGRDLSMLPEDLKAKEILEGKKENAIIEETNIEEVKPVENDYASHYYVPLDQNIPAPSDNNIDHDNKDNNGGENV